MQVNRRACRRFVLTSVAVFAVGGGAAALVSLPGCVPIGDGTLDGTLAGRVTNELTDAGVAGVTVSIEPAVEGVEITTGSGGAFSQSVPAGVYTVTFEDSRFEAQSRAVGVVPGVTTRIHAALTPKQPVFVSASVSGDAAPGGVLTATAEVEVLDGSAVSPSFAWSQSNSVEVTIANGNTATATVTLPGNTAFKDELLNVIAEPPIAAEDLPPNVPVPEGEFPAGLQERFQVLGLNPFSLEEAGLITLNVTVTTDSGTFSDSVDIHTALPWKVTTGIRNVPAGVPVLMHGKTQESYNWALTRPAGSTASLADADTRNPYFTPDASGTYTLTVTDTTVDPSEVVTMDVIAGTWEGAITGQNAKGRPLAANCTACHNDNLAPDVFTPWMETGHAEIFTDNLSTSTHYGESCFACHTVGYDPGVDNGGVDEASDYQDFLNAGLLNNPGDNWTTVLNQFPETGQRANIQCENCHGPQDSAAHTGGVARVSLSSDVCASCHGEPLRHARFQQWQLSAHANFELAIDEGESGNCSRCHTANGFLAWLPILLDDDPATDPLDDIEVTWSAEETFPQTCATCHDPHDVGTTTGVGTNARVRIAGDTPPLIAGFQVFGAGRGAICMTCHNSRRGLHNDDTFDTIVGTSEVNRAPHGSAQTDVLMGQNAFFVEAGIRGSHSLVADTCVNCHMERTPPPDLLAYNLGGTNHTFFASADICAKCHGESFDAEGVQSAFESTSDELHALIEEAIEALMAEQIAAGNSIDLGGEATLSTLANVDDIAFGESRGQQAITVTVNGEALGPFTMSAVRVFDATDTDLGALYDFADERLIKSGWNWNLVNNDGSRGVHNPAFVLQVVDSSVDELLGLLGG